MMKAKDYLGNEFEVGDTVVYTGRGTAWLYTAVVTKITAKMVFLGEDTRQFHNQVIKIEGIK